MTENIPMLIGHEHGQVVMKFMALLDRVDIDPERAIDIAEALAAAAFEARDGVQPVGHALKAELADRQREVIGNRFAVILNSTREDRLVTNQKLAQELADIALREVYS